MLYQLSYRGPSARGVYINPGAGCKFDFEPAFPDPGPPAAGKDGCGTRGYAAIRTSRAAFGQPDR
jgi:hypothetical protein